MNPRFTRAIAILSVVMGGAFILAHQTGYVAERTMWLGLTVMGILVGLWRVTREEAS